MERRRLYSAGGFGLLFAVYVGMIGHPGESAGEFFFGSSLGIACAGVLAAAAGLALQRGRVSRLSDRFMSLLVLVLGFGIALVGAILRFLGALGYAAAPSLSGILFGAGCLFLALVWTRIYAAYHFIEALRRGSLALLCSVFFSLVMSFVPNAAVVDGCYVAALCFSLPFALYELLRIQGLDRPTADVAREGGVRARFASLAKTAWGPLCGLGICSFLLGSLWMQAFPLAGSSVQGGGPAGLPSVGPLVAMRLIGFATSRITSYDQARKLFWVVMPITAAIFLITPSLEEVTLPYWNLLVSNLQNGGSICMVFCTWALLLLGSRTNGFSVEVVFGASLALVAALSILGAFTFEALGQGGNVVTVVMFILYMGAVILFLAWGGAEDRASTTQARDFFEAFIQSRCNKLAAAHGLTPRETELLALLGRGHGYAYIAESLYISETTVRTHARNIYHKLGIASQEELLSLIDHTELGEEH